ncbi:MAG: hypothetical protein JRE40_04025 [Deltaproteobacteria bacterium]|nr:hypothetical protein [Deltaproteobacteria bacterium]
MCPVDLTRLSPHHQRFIARQARVSERNKKPKEKQKKLEALGEEFDSKLELEFAWELERRRLAHMIDEWRYHPMRFRIAKNANYTPDFLTRVGSRFTIFEVKGSWDSKNARDSRTRLQVAAYMYQWHTWIGVTRSRHKEWVYETIHATEAEVEPMHE